MKRLIGCLGLLILTGLFLPGFLSFPGYLVIWAVFGWVFFLVRVVTETEIGWPGVATAVVCLAAFSAGLHAFLAWLWARTRAEPEGTERRWSPRWTGAIVAVVVLMFVAGLATVGATHQVGWLLTSKEALAESSSRVVRRIQSGLNLKNIGHAFLLYPGSNHDALPGATFDREGRPLQGWMTGLLPFVDQADLYNQINIALPWDDPRNAAPFRKVVNTYINPGVRPKREADDSGRALAHYAENARMVGVRSWKDVTDGTSQTILAGEVAGGFAPWGDPVNWRDPAEGINKSPGGFGGPHEGGANVLFADGSVRFIQDHVSPQVLKALATPDGGERPSDGEF